MTLSFRLLDPSQRSKGRRARMQPKVAARGTIGSPVVGGVPQMSECLSLEVRVVSTSTYPVLLAFLCTGGAR